MASDGEKVQSPKSKSKSKVATVARTESATASTVFDFGPSLDFLDLGRTHSDYRRDRGRVNGNSGADAK